MKDQFILSACWNHFENIADIRQRSQEKIVCHSDLKVEGEDSASQSNTMGWTNDHLSTNIDLLTSKDIKNYKQSELGQKVTTKERIEEITNNLQGRKRESYVCFFQQKWFEQKWKLFIYGFSHCWYDFVFGAKSMTL